MQLEDFVTIFTTNAHLIKVRFYNLCSFDQGSFLQPNYYSFDQGLSVAWYE